jgi:hypothetical protein
MTEQVESPQGGMGKYTFTSMRPQRERSGSISSDTSGGSDLSWEDLEAEYEKEKPDWNTQVLKRLHLQTLYLNSDKMRIEHTPL